MKKYSQNLIDRLITYFQKKYGISLTFDKAESYLDSLADFFIWLNGKNKENHFLRQQK